LFATLLKLKHASVAAYRLLNALAIASGGGCSTFFPPSVSLIRVAASLVIPDRHRVVAIGAGGAVATGDGCADRPCCAGSP
jgi:hypothetical protein